MPLDFRFPPVLRSDPAKIPAACYNRVRRAMRRGGPGPLLVMLPGQRGYEMLLHPDSWVCSDRRLGTPILGWHGFCTEARAGVHEPVACRLEHYHGLGSTVLHTVLNDLEMALDRLLPAPEPAGSARLLVFPPR